VYIYIYSRTLDKHITSVYLYLQPADEEEDSDDEGIYKPLNTSKYIIN